MSKATDAWNAYKLTDEDRQKISKLGNDPRIGKDLLLATLAESTALL